MYALVLYLYLSLDCAGCRGDLHDVETVGSYATLAGCQQAGKQLIAERSKGSATLEYECLRIGARG
jgi:hypothetical protein